MDPVAVVKVGKAPGKIEDNVAVVGKDGKQPTVEDAVAAIDLELEEGDDIRLNGQKVTKDAAVQNGDTVLVLGDISGN